MTFKEVPIGGKFVLRFYPSDNGWMCGITNEMMDDIQKLKWVGLTDEEVRQHVMPYLDGEHFPTVLYLARLLEEILKERNT